MKSAIFAGQLEHRRYSPRPHAFRYRTFMMYLDLAELDSVFEGRRFWSSKRPALARFRREDHLGSPDTPLDTAVRDLVEKQSGRRPVGPIRLLTHLSYFGYCFNPVSFYYCYEADEARLSCIVAEVNNTPWGEQHCYVMNISDADHSGADQSGDIHRFSPDKAMHVSPFMPMDIDYDWRFRQPTDRLHVYMANHRQGSKLFDAVLKLQRVEITSGALAKVLLLFPFMTMKVMLAIHWQALRLWLKRTPVYDHPEKHISTNRKQV